MRSVRPVARFGFLAASLLLATACATAGPAHEATAEGSVHWGYEGPGSAEHWGDLSPEFAVCETGTQQSPIDLANATRADLPDLRVDYRPTPLAIENKGHTVQVNYQPGSSMTVGGATYELVQFHFHTPAEHRLRGAELPAELHLVHRSPAGELAVLGVFIQRGDENRVLEPVWDHLPATAGDEKHVPSLRIDAENLLPAGREHYRYPGSLTTPPCTEGVQWFVLEEPIELSSEQIDALHSIIGTSNRPVQPLGNRDLRFGR